MLSHSITIPKTARYFTWGANETAEHIWFVCHGYAQLANYFLEKFKVLNPENHLVVAPEGLHRFYWQGFGGRVVASWMTKEDRESDIRDYVNFLDAVYTEIMSKVKNKQATVTVLGFSQGTATVCRWLALGKAQAHRLILWAGVFPPDVPLQADKKVFEQLMTYLVAGNQDEFIDEKQLREHQEFLQKHQIPYHFIPFEGKHEILPAVLLELAPR